MLGGIISLASYGIASGGTVGNILFTLEQNGVFAYLLPFLMIFAIIFGILTKIEIFEQKGINIVLAISVGLMSLQLNFVSYFFEQIFPRMGIALAIIFVAMVLIGMFWDFDKPWVKFIFGLMILIGVIVIVVQSFGDSFMFYGYGSSWAITYWLEEYMRTIIIIALSIGAIWAIVAFGGKDDKKDGKKKKVRSSAEMTKLLSAITRD